MSWSSQTLQYAHGWCRSGRPVSLYSHVNQMSKQWCYRNFLKWLVCVCKFACHLQLFKTKIKFFIIPSIRGPESFCKKKTQNSHERKSTDKQRPHPKRGEAGQWSIPSDMLFGNIWVLYVIFHKKLGQSMVCSLRKIESSPSSTCKLCMVYLCLNEKIKCFSYFHELE